MAFQIIPGKPAALLILCRFGWQEVHRLRPRGRLFTLTLIVSGCGTITDAVGSMMPLMVAGRPRRLPGRKTLENRISKLSNNSRICGFDRIGCPACSGFFARPRPFVEAEKNLQAVSILQLEQIARREPSHAV